MRRGDRLEFRNLRCAGKYYKERTLRDGTEFTEYHYRFAGIDGREYLYRGRYYHGVEPGCYWSVKATVGYVEGNKIWLKRPIELDPQLDQSNLPL